MAYQVLARKYRPQRFSDVVGQDHVTRTLMNALVQGRIAHGYIFSGHRGIGKTTIARILAMALNCRTAIGVAERPTPEPCGVCDSCTEVRAGNAVDVIEIDAATNRGIDEIRELRDAARYRPARDRYKIYILDEAHQITDAAFNALLKTLEEPPDHVVFMMATTQPEDIPQTIRSRCQHFSFHAVKFDDIVLQLRTIAGEEKIEASDEALALLAEAGDGSMRDALSIMDQAIASAPVTETGVTGEGRPALDAEQIRELMGSVPSAIFERLLEAVSENQSGPVVEEINRLLNAGNSASQLARQFVRYLRNALMARIAGEASELLQLSPDERARAGRSALLFSEEDLARFLQVMLRTFDELNYRQEPRFHLELGVLKLVHLQRLLPVEQLLSQLGGGAAPPPKLGGGPLPGTARSGAAAGQPGGRSGPPAVPAATQNRPTTPGARGTMAAEPAPSERPAFSPFEQDRQRKVGESPRKPEGRPELSGSPAPGPAAGPEREIAAAANNGVRAEASPAATEIARKLPKLPVPGLAIPGSTSPGSTSPGSTSPASAITAPSAPELWAAEVDRQGESGKVDSVAIEAGSETDLETGSEAAEFEQTEEEVRGTVPAELGLNADYSAAAGDGAAAGALDLVREQVCSALEQAGHNTAAALLANGNWVEQDGGLRVEVAAKKTMLGLTMNAEAEKICREAVRSLGGVARPLTFVSAEPGRVGGGKPAAAGPGGPVPAVAGSAQARAMDNPLVKQAQELFGAEVRSVLDLRNK